MTEVLGAVVVALVAVLNVYVAVPVGYGFDLSPGATAAAAFVGSVGGTMAMVFVGHLIMPPVRRIYDRVRPGRGDAEGPEAAEASEDAKESSRARSIVDRFGAPGFGLIGPMTIGGFATAISGVAMGIPKVKLAIWLGIGQALVVILYSLLVDTTVAS